MKSFFARSKMWTVMAVLATTFVAYQVVMGEEGAPPAGSGDVSFFAVAKNMTFMGYILIMVSIAGFALFLQCLAQIRPHLLRPPELAQELVSLCQEGNLEEAGNAAQSDDSMLGVVATAALSNIDRGKQSMQEAMQEAGDIESQKYIFRIGMLQLIGAVAPMLGLTGTTLGMIKTFAVIGKKADAVSPSDMAIGISEALICTFLGLMVAIPLIIGSYFLKGRLNQTTSEVANDVNEMIRASSPQENA